MKKQNRVSPKSKITIKGNSVKIVIVCLYPASKTSNTADKVWDIVSDFTSIKTIFPLIIRNYITYPTATNERIGTIRDMTFGSNPISIGIEKLTKINDKTRSLSYVSLEGLPVTNYLGVMKVKGSNACTLTWTITYNQKSVNKKFARIMAGIFVTAEEQIGKIVGSK